MVIGVGGIGGVGSLGEVGVIGAIRVTLVTGADGIEKGTYGICEISGQPIEAERLKANPAARTSQANQEKEAQLPL